MGLLEKIKRLFKKDEPPFDFGDEGTDGEGERAKINNSAIVSFGYRYNGSIGGNSYSYEIDARKTPAVLKTEHMIYPEYGELTKEIDAAFVNKLEELYKDCRLAAWNGFNKYNPHICDGDGFSLSIRFADGGECYAHGSNSFPRGYGEFKTKLNAIFDPVVRQMHEEARQKIIDGGISGELRFFMANFIQKGSSGSDRYEALVSEQGVRTQNFDVRIKSVSGEFIEPGEYRICREVLDEAIGFGEFDAIVKKHNVMRWYNHDKAAEDYNNSEWFQLSLDFGDRTVNACGTEHPEGYDEFRREFLAQLVKTFVNIRDNVL